MRFHPIIKLPTQYPVFDFTGEKPVPNPEDYTFGIGKYLEKRPFIYTESQYENRVIHMGVDIQAPAGTEVYAPCDATVWGVKNNNSPQDYGFTLILEAIIEDKNYWLLFGHLNEKTFEEINKGDSVKKGDVIAWLGDRNENGGWKPHLHFQVSIKEPVDVDMPGVVSEVNLEEAKLCYPDPRILLGKIY